MNRVVVAAVLCFLIATALAQPKLLLILVHEPLQLDQTTGVVPSQAAWVVWRRDANAPLALATGRWAEVPPQRRPTPKLLSPANAARNQHQLWVPTRPQTQTILQQTLASRLAQVGYHAIYLATPDSPSPSPYALVAIPEKGKVEARFYPSLESLRLNFFQLPADWAVLELKRWNYKSLELLLAEGVEVWVLSVAAPRDLALPSTRLTGLIRYAAREPRGLLTSPSTRWSGVIREVDIVPSVYRALTGQNTRSVAGASALETRQSDWHRFWNGRLVRLAIREATESVGIAWHGNALKRSAEWTQANAQLAPILRGSALGISVGWLGTSLLLWFFHKLHGRVRRVLISGLAVLGLLPAVAVLYAYYPFAFWTGAFARDLAAIASWLMLGWLALSLVAGGIARWKLLPPLAVASVAALSIVCLDLLLAGGYGVNRSLLSLGTASAQQMFGANEWFWGFAVATCLMAPASWLESRGRTHLTGAEQAAIGMLYGTTLLLIGMPMLGAALDAWLPMTLAFGWGIGLFTGLLPERVEPRRLIAPLAGLVLAGVALSAAAIALDALQPWQRQAGWARTWLSVSNWHALPLKLLGVAALTGGLCYLLRRTLSRLWTQAYFLSRALVGCGLAIGGALLVGKAIAAIVILALCLMFVLEYLAGSKEWGYLHAGNGIAH